MSQYKNLADPNFEPTDEQLLELSSRAFAHIPKENAVFSDALQDRIAKKQLALFLAMTEQQKLQPV